MTKRPRGGKADTRDLKSRAPMARPGSNPGGGTISSYDPYGFTVNLLSLDTTIFDPINKRFWIITINWLPPGSAHSWRRGVWK